MTARQRTDIIIVLLTFVTAGAFGYHEGRESAKRECGKWQGRIQWEPFVGEGAPSGICATGSIYVDQSTGDTFFCVEPSSVKLIPPISWRAPEPVASLEPK